MVHDRRPPAPRGPLLTFEGVLATMPPPHDHDRLRAGGKSWAAGGEARGQRGGVREEEGDKEEASADVAAKEAFLAEWISIVSEDAQQGAHAVRLDGTDFDLAEVLRAVEGMGGRGKVHSWRLVSDALVESKTGRKMSSLSAGVKVKQFYFDAELHLLEDRNEQKRLRMAEEYERAKEAGAEQSAAAETSAASAEQDKDKMEVDGEAEHEGEATAGAAVSVEKEVVLMWGDKPWSAELEREALSSGRYMDKDGELLVMVHSNGQCTPIPKSALVLGTDGFLHHGDVLGREGTQRDLDRFNHVDEAMSHVWWERVRTFYADKSVQLESSVLNTSKGDLSLFALYHQVMRNGGLEEAVKADRLEAVGRALGLGQYPGMDRELRQLYATCLYSFECYDTMSLRVLDVGQDLFGRPVKAKAAAAKLKAMVGGREGGESGEGRFGLGGAVGARGKRVWERAAGNMASENGEGRRKRLCRAIHSQQRSELAWALGVLTVNGHAAANFMEPHVELDDRVVEALARFVLDTLTVQPHFATGALLIVEADAEENVYANTGVALSVLYNYTHLEHQAVVAAENAGLMAALTAALLSSSRKVTALALLVLENVSKLMPYNPKLSPDLVSALGQVAELDLDMQTKPSLLKTVALLSNGHGEMISRTMSGSVEEHALDLLDSMEPDGEKSALSFIMEGCQASPDLQRRLGEDRLLLDGLVRLLCAQHHSIRQTMAAKALRYLLNPHSRCLRERLLRYEEEIAHVSISLASTANRDTVSDLGRILTFVGRRTDGQ